MTCKQIRDQLINIRNSGIDLDLFLIGEPDVEALDGAIDILDALLDDVQSEEDIP